VGGKTDCNNIKNTITRVLHGLERHMSKLSSIEGAFPGQEDIIHGFIRVRPPHTFHIASGRQTWKSQNEIKGENKIKIKDETTVRVINAERIELCGMPLSLLVHRHMLVSYWLLKETPQGPLPYLLSSFCRPLSNKKKSAKSKKHLRVVSIS
jgi:hypothetical protein